MSTEDRRLFTGGNYTVLVPNNDAMMRWFEKLDGELKPSINKTSSVPYLKHWWQTKDNTLTLIEYVSFCVHKIVIYM